MMDWLLESTTIKWFKNKNNELQKREAILCLHGIMDGLMCGFASAAEEFKTASLRRKNTIVNMSSKEYETALVAAAAEFDDLMKLRIRGKPVTYESSYFSSKAVAAQKKQRAAGSATIAKKAMSGRTQQAPIGKKPVATTAGVQSQAWTSWSEEAASFTAAKRTVPKFDAEASRNKGAFLCKPAFDFVLSPELAKKYCGKFLVWGRCCDPAKGTCKKKHVPFYRFQAAEKAEQYHYTLANKENICINANDVPRDMPEKCSHLVRIPGQGAK